MDKALVFLDLDDTILDFGKAEKRAFGLMLRDMGLEEKQEYLNRYSEINVQQWERLEKGLATRDEILVKRFEIFFSEQGISCCGEHAAQLYENYLCQGHFFIDGAEELLNELEGRYRLFIVSNGSAVVQAGRLKSAGIAPYFEKIFISEKIGFNKPDKRFFECCFSEIKDFDAGRSVIVGDSLSSDILGGINAGIKTVWFNRKGQPQRKDIKADYEISALGELPGLLKVILR